MELEQVEIDEERLDRINKGCNFYNVGEQEENYFIEVLVEIEQTLQDTTEEFVVNHNLPIEESYYDGNSVNDFLKELKDFVNKPIAKIKTANRKRVMDYGDLNTVKNNFRNETLRFGDIDIIIGSLAEKQIKYDFKKKVKELLLLQKEADNKIQKEVDRFVELREKVLSLKGLIIEKTNGYNYGYEDETIKITIPTNEYNKRLKEIEIEIEKVAKKLNIKDIGKFDYQSSQKKVSYEVWLKVNRNELEDNYEGEEEDEDEDGEKLYKDFDDYAEQMFDESEGIIEVEYKS